MVAAIGTLCALLWGSAVPAVKAGYALFAITPDDTASLMLFAGLRFGLAGLLLLGFALLQRKPVWPGRTGLVQVGALGLLSTALQYGFYYVGLAHTSGVKVSITTSTSTFFSVLLAHFLYVDDKLSVRRVLGCLVGFAGVVAVNLSAAGFDLNVSLLGEGFILIAALMFSLAGIYGKRLSRRLDPVVMTGWQLFAGGAVLGLIGLMTGGHLGAPDLEALGLLFYLVVLSAAAFALWSLLLKHNPVGTVAIFNCLIPVFGVTLSAMVLGENVLEWKNLAALVLVVAGIWLVNRPVAGVPKPV